MGTIGRAGRLLLLVSVPCTGLHALQTIEPERVYEAGTRVTSTATGVSFVIPESRRASFDEDIGTFVAASPNDPNTILGVWAYSEATLPEIVTAVENRLVELGVSLTAKEPMREEPTRVSGLFFAMTEDGPGVMYAVARAGSAGNAVLVAGLGLTDREQTVIDAVDDMTESVQFSSPGAVRWRQEVGGTVFETSSSSSEYSPGGAGAGSAASQGRATLDLCSDGSYAFESSFESYMSVAGAGSYSRSDNDAHTGQWWLVADIMGSATLVLEATDGREFQWTARERDNAYLIDGKSYTAAPSQRCP